MKVPALDLGSCTECEGCMVVCPAVFRWNEGAGYIEVVELDQYPETEVNEAIKICPASCIVWEER
ncbi:MAG: ferredoxin [Desulfobulbaceae bacterium]|nr:ferredoxin [Desulfobulbaceae bacterium]